MVAPILPTLLTHPAPTTDDAQSAKAASRMSPILYLDQQSIDTTTPIGKLLFQVTGAFAEFERSMIRTRVNAGLKRAKDEIKRTGHFVTKHGEVKKRLGRPNADPDKLQK